jgi:hypothetical protein
MTLDELSMRQAILKHSIAIISEQTDDERRPSALEYYQKQLADIEAQIASQKPPPIIVRLMPGIIGAQAHKIGR